MWEVHFNELCVSCKCHGQLLLVFNDYKHLTAKTNRVLKASTDFV